MFKVKTNTYGFFDKQNKNFIHKTAVVWILQSF